MIRVLEIGGRGLYNGIEVNIYLVRKKQKASLFKGDYLQYLPPFIQEPLKKYYLSVFFRAYESYYP